jgi:hypothetical protein
MLACFERLLIAELMDMEEEDRHKASGKWELP